MLDNDVIDATKLTDASAALRCARLYLLGGKRSVKKGETNSGIVALYDSVLFGMRYYVTRHKGCDSYLKNVALWDAASMFHALTLAGVFDDPLLFNRFSLIVERALWQGSFPSDTKAILINVEKMLTKLEVMPLDKSRLMKTYHTNVKEGDIYLD